MAPTPILTPDLVIQALASIEADREAFLEGPRATDAARASFAMEGHPFTSLSEVAARLRMIGGPRAASAPEGTLLGALKRTMAGLDGSKVQTDPNRQRNVGARLLTPDVLSRVKVAEAFTADLEATIQKAVEALADAGIIIDIVDHEAGHLSVYSSVWERHYLDVPESDEDDVD